MDERDVGENVTRPRAQVAVKVPECLGAIEGAGHKPGVSPFSSRGEAQAAHKLAQNFRRLVMSALHETAEPVAAYGVRDVVILDGVAAGARPARAEGGERAHSHADAASVLKGLIIQAEGWGVWHSIEPHAAGPAGGAIEECPGPVGVPKALQLRSVGGCKGV
jgi:hypothetical protein